MPVRCRRYERRRALHRLWHGRVDPVTHASDSAVQREAEAVIVKAISEQLGTLLEPRRVDLPGGTGSKSTE